MMFYMFDEFLLRRIFIFCRADDRKSIAATCRFWFKNAYFVAPHESYKYLARRIRENIDPGRIVCRMDRLWKFAGEYMRPTPYLLAAAARNGSEPFMRQLIERGTTYNRYDCITILTNVVVCGDESAVEYVLDTFDYTSMFNPCMDIIISNKNIAALRVFLRHPRFARVYLPHMHFERACHYGFYTGMKLLLADPRVDPGANSGSALQTACSSGHYAIVDHLLRHPAVDPTVDQSSALSSACDTNQWAIVQRLLADGRVQPHVKDSYMLTDAARRQHYMIVRLLIADGRVDPTVNDYSAVFNMCQQGHVDILQMMFEFPGMACFIDARSKAKFYFDSDLWRRTGQYTLTRHPTEEDKKFPVTNFLLAGVVCNQLNVVDFFLSDEKLKTRFDPANRDCIALKFACRLRHWEIVARLLDDKRTDPRVEQNLALKEAIQHNQNALALRILRCKNANPNDEVLDVACAHGNVEMVLALMERPSINPAVRNNRVVSTAVRECQSTIAVFLINDRRIDVTRNDHELFHLACLKNDAPVVAAILKKTKVISYDDICTRLSVAFSNNETELAKLLVSEITRNQIVLKPEHMKTLLEIACCYYDAILFDLCYEQLGVNPFADNDLSPLLAAVEHGSDKIVERLLKDARSFTARDPEGQVLRRAFEQQSESIAKMLVAHPVFFHRGVALQTAEFYMQRGDTFFVQFLLEYRDIRDALDIYTAALTLVERNHLDMINLLMQYNILDPSIHDNDLLMCAVQNLHHHIVDRFLRDPRVDPTARGGHAMSLAIGLNDQQMLAMLRTAIRKRNRRKYEQEIRGLVVKVDDDDDDDDNDSDASANEDLLVMRKKIKLI